VNTQERLLKLIRDNDGKRPVFISHNSFPTVMNGQPTSVSVSKTFYDFDHPTDPALALYDARKLVCKMLDEHFPIAAAYSGSKGFHVYILHKPVTLPLVSETSDLFRAVHVWAQRDLGLRTLDLRAADPRRLCRVWFTRYVKEDKRTGKFDVGDTHCVPLTPKMIMEWDMSRIVDYSKHPVEWVRTPHEVISDSEFLPSLMTLNEFITHFKIDVGKLLYSNANLAIVPQDQLPFDPETDRFLYEILRYPCVYKAMVNASDPPHMARFAAAIAFKNAGLSSKWVFEFFRHRKYVDEANTRELARQLNSIYNHTPAYNHPSCKRLIAEGMCFGSACPRWQPKFQEYVNEQKKGSEKKDGI